MTTIYNLPNNHIAVEPWICEGDIDELHEVWVTRMMFSDYNGLFYKYKWNPTEDDGSPTNVVYLKGTILEKGKWKVLGWSDDVKVAEQVVIMNENSTYMNYIGCWGGFTTAKGSIKSLLRSVGCKSDNVLILKKVD